MSNPYIKNIRVAYKMLLDWMDITLHDNGTRRIKGDISLHPAAPGLHVRA